MTQVFWIKKKKYRKLRNIKKNKTIARDDLRLYESFVCAQHLLDNAKKHASI